jgi:PII-like signaling protein
LVTGGLALARRRVVDGFTSGKLLRIFVDDNDRAGTSPLYAEIVEFLRQHGMAGATVFRGIQGFGGHAVMHRAAAFAWMPNLPILIEVLDSDDNVARILPELRALIPDGLIALEPIEFERLKTGAAPAR